MKSIVASFLLAGSFAAAQDEPITLRVGTLINGRGGLTRDAVVVTKAPESRASGETRKIRSTTFRDNLFASKSIREGGAQTMTDEQIQAACDEARKLGLRSWVHAHAASAMKAAALAGCTAVAHGSQGTDEVFALMAERGVYFEPNIGLVSQNYLAHKPQYFGIGTYTEEGFAFMERNIPIKLDMYRRAMEHPKLKLLMGTDATAGAHGRNAEEIIYRIEKAGQKPMDASRARLPSRPSLSGFKTRSTPPRRGWRRTSSRSRETLFRMRPLFDASPSL